MSPMESSFEWSPHAYDVNYRMEPHYKQSFHYLGLLAFPAPCQNGVLVDPAGSPRTPFWTGDGWDCPGSAWTCIMWEVYQTDLSKLHVCVDSNSNLSNIH